MCVAQRSTCTDHASHDAQSAQGTGGTRTSCPEPCPAPPRPSCPVLTAQLSRPGLGALVQGSADGRHSRRQRLIFTTGDQALHEDFCSTPPRLHA